MEGGGCHQTRVRALLDSCSESSLVSHDLALKFGYAPARVRIGITGVTGDIMDSTVTRVRLQIRPPGSRRLQSFEAFGLRRLGIRTPSHPLSRRSAQIFKDLPLADPDYGLPRDVDIVLGADVYSSLICPGVQIRGELAAQRTVFGWVVTGKERRSHATHETATYTTTTALRPERWHEVLSSLIQKFWATEEVPHVMRQAPEDVACETLFQDEHRRTDSGRYSVPLPLIPGALGSLGESLNNAQRILRSVHERMRRDKHFRDEYVKFMDEHLQLGHMRRLTDAELQKSSPRPQYLPHHGIWQGKNLRRRLRVVFNASCPTSSGRCLNDAFRPVPKLQSYLPSIVVGWRWWRIAYCADIRMMFRMVRVNQEYTHLQRILWSESPEEPVNHYELETLTYGETPSPYLARRTLKQLCIDEGHAFPKAVQSIEDELYVDDFLSGEDLVEDALDKRDQLIELLQRGGFELRKWVSNHQRIIEDIPAKNRLRPDWFQLTSEGPVNELGIRWDPVTDCLTFAAPTIKDDDHLTKRQVLSEIARLFDPAGWLSPIVVLAKMIMQDLWRAKVDWDNDLPEHLARRWRQFRANIKDVSAITLRRWLHWTPTCGTQLHAFADSSSRAMAATVYLRTEGCSGVIVTSFVMAKTKLVSLKSLSRSNRPDPRMTIPRLELRATLMAAQILRTASHDLGVSPQECYAWSDSSSALHWLRSNKSLGHHLVDNYVSHVHEVMPGCHWRYVPTAENPADIATRGATPSDLTHNQLWWSGPTWLTKSSKQWPVSTSTIQTPPSVTKDSVSRLNCLATQGSATDVMDRFSSLTRLLRTLVRCRRLLRRKMDLRRTINPPTPRPVSPITAGEVQLEFTECVRRSQRRSYGVEIKELERGRPVSKSSPLRAPCPFIDDDRIIRVGGWLQESQLPYDERHPPILDGKCPLARLIINWAHIKTLHGGFRVTYAHTMRRAWLVRGRVQVKAHIRHCVPCSRTRSRASTQVMAPLPAPRVTPSRPFNRCGVNYAGPFQVLSSRGRGIRSSKGYVAVFVCLSTKALHLELDGDLTTASYLGALTRFSGRRGRPREIWSDNATNFRGARDELRQMLKQAELDWNLISNTLASEGIQWQLIPPSSPHFGGLWETGVKSVKTHLRRVGGTRRLTFEEFSTLLESIEAVLNSHPLEPISGGPDDLDALTPAHFLVGGSLLSLPQPCVPNVDLDHVSHWQLVKGMRDRFWSRWSREYLNTLQQRFKWNRPR